LDHQPRSRLLQEKKRRDRLIRLATDHPTWALGFADAVWWSRLAHPDQHRWIAPGKATRLQALSGAKEDPDPKALACYGLLVRRRPPQAEQLQLRFVKGRPVSAVTTEFLAWCCDRLAVQGITALLLIWDHASWHKSQFVRTWIRTHNQGVKANRQGVRIVACLLPVKSPWLNPIEPKWIHGKRAVSEPDRLLSAVELETRIYAYYGCAREVPLVMPKKVA
jgi:DDE superfamily endonuclease